MKLNESEADEVDASYKKTTRRTSLPKIKFEESKQHDRDDLSNLQYNYRGAQSSRVTENNMMSEGND